MPAEDNTPAKAQADPATLFAAERTLLAWIRTGLSLMGFGFALARFGLYLREAAPTNVQSPHFSVAVGILLVAFGVGTNVVAVAGHVRVIRLLRSGAREFPARLSTGVLLAAALGLLGLAGCVYLLTL